MSAAEPSTSARSGDLAISASTSSVRCLFVTTSPHPLTAHGPAVWTRVPVTNQSRQGAAHRSGAGSDGGEGRRRSPPVRWAQGQRSRTQTTGVLVSLQGSSGDHHALATRLIWEYIVLLSVEWSIQNLNRLLLEW